MVTRLQKPNNLDKVYEVLVWGRLQPEQVEQMLTGVKTHLGMLKAKTVEILGELEPQVRVRVVLSEGKNRQIRRMFAGLRDWKTNESLKVVELKRTHLGPLTLDVESGTWRFLAETEIEGLFKCIPRK